jgi:hypothetical protein
MRPEGRLSRHCSIVARRLVTRAPSMPSICFTSMGRISETSHSRNDAHGFLPC